MSEFKVVIVFEGDAKLIETLYQSLKPDNVDIPNGMQMEMSIEGKLLTMTFVINEERLLLSLISTIDEVLNLSETTVKVLSDV